MHKNRRIIILIGLTLLAIAVITAIGPAEKTLGTNVRVVYLHGAWVWAALCAFFGAGAAGAIGLITRRKSIHKWSLCSQQNRIIVLDHISSTLYVGDANQLERSVFGGTPLADGDYFRGMRVIDPDRDHFIGRPDLGQRGESGVSDRSGICGIQCPGCYAPFIARYWIRMRLASRSISLDYCF